MLDDDKLARLAGRLREFARPAGHREPWRHARRLWWFEARVWKVGRAPADHRADRAAHATPDALMVGWELAHLTGVLPAVRFGHDRHGIKGATTDLGKVVDAVLRPDQWFTMSAFTCVEPVAGQPVSVGWVVPESAEGQVVVFTELSMLGSSAFQAMPGAVVLDVEELPADEVAATTGWEWA